MCAFESCDIRFENLTTKFLIKFFLTPPATHTHTCKLAIRHLEAHRMTLVVTCSTFCSWLQSHQRGGSPAVLQLKAESHHAVNNEYRIPIQSFCILVQRHPARPCVKQLDTQLYANEPQLGLSLLSRASVPALREKTSDEEGVMRNRSRVCRGGSMHVNAHALAACNNVPCMLTHTHKCTHRKYWEHKSFHGKSWRFY